MNTYKVQMKKHYETDVLVCDLGPAGISAAAAAARDGMKTMGVETCAYAGGNITNANVVGVCGALNLATGDLVIHH